MQVNKRKSIIVVAALVVIIAIIVYQLVIPQEMNFKCRESAAAGYAEAYVHMEPKEFLIHVEEVRQSSDYNDKSQPVVTESEANISREEYMQVQRMVLEMEAALIYRAFNDEEYRLKYEHPIFKIVTQINK